MEKKREKKEKKEERAKGSMEDKETVGDYVGVASTRYTSV